SPLLAQLRQPRLRPLFLGLFLGCLCRFSLVGTAEIPDEQVELSVPVPIHHARLGSYSPLAGTRVSTGAPSTHTRWNKGLGGAEFRVLRRADVTEPNDTAVVRSDDQVGFPVAIPVRDDWRCIAANFKRLAFSQQRHRVSKYWLCLLTDVSQEPYGPVHSAGN